jgi:hypothetical protein
MANERVDLAFVADWNHRGDTFTEPFVADLGAPTVAPTVRRASQAHRALSSEQLVAPERQLGLVIRA